MRLCRFQSHVCDMVGLVIVCVSSQILRNKDIKFNETKTARNLHNGIVIRNVHALILFFPDTSVRPQSKFGQQIIIIIDKNIKEKGIYKK